MKLIRPTTLTDAMLNSSTAAENDYAVWSSSTAYAVGSRVILTSTHRKYEALAASTGVNPASDPTKWLDLGPTNRWAMFDARVGTATTRAGSLQVVLAPGAADGLALIDIEAEKRRGAAVGRQFQEGRLVRCAPMPLAPPIQPRP